MKMKASALVLSMMLAAMLPPAFSAPATQATDNGDATDRALDACLNNPKTQSTADTSDCYGAAYSAYDKRMNTAYQGLLKKLPAAIGLKLRASQRAWVSFRQAETGTLTGIFSTTQGTMFVPMQQYEYMTLTRDRALQLESYLRVLAVD